LDDECCFVGSWLEDGSIPGTVLDGECWLQDFCFDPCVVGFNIDNICVVDFDPGFEDT